MSEIDGLLGTHETHTKGATDKNDETMKWDKPMQGRIDIQHSIEVWNSYLESKSQT